MTNPRTETGEKGMMEIPEDVIKAATEFQDMVDRDPKAYVAFDVAVLAILAEREACAKIADSLQIQEYHPRLSPGSELNAWWTGQEHAAIHVATAIRNRSAGK